MTTAVITLSGAQLIGLIGLTWRVSRWQTRVDARLTYLERRGNGLYDKSS